MVEMQQGKDKILLFRRLADAGNENAIKLVFQVEHTFTYNRELDKVVTKDGVVVKVGELEAEVPIEAIQSKGDPAFTMLQEAMKKGEKLELWEVNISPELEENGKYPAVYAQGYLDSWELPANVEDEATISSNFIVELEPQEGMATLTEEIESAVQYAFRDTVADGAGGGVEG